MEAHFDAMGSAATASDRAAIALYLGRLIRRTSRI
jgi:hypothetical protein